MKGRVTAGTAVTAHAWRITRLALRRVSLAQDDEQCNGSGWAESDSVE